MEKDGEVQIINDIQGKVAFTCVSASRGGSGGVFCCLFLYTYHTIWCFVAARPDKA